MIEGNIRWESEIFKIEIFLDVNFLSQQAKYVLQLSHNDQISISGSSQDITLQSEIAPIIVLQRTDKEPWKSVSSKVDRLICN
jgi:hypothetical protein